MAVRERWKNLGAALSIVGAMAGAGLASGREVVTFFSASCQYAGLGIAVAAVSIGVFSAGLMILARRWDVKTLPQLAQKLLGKRMGRAAAILYWLCCALTAAVMLSAGGELMQLTLDVRGAYGIGALATLALAILLARSGSRRSFSGGALFVGLVLFGLWMAMDRREVAVEPYLALGIQPMGGPLSAVLLGVAYAALNVSLCAAALVRLRDRQPARVAIALGAMMGAVLLTLHAAISLQPKGLMARALPCVLLAARYGLIGSQICILLMELAVVTTLATMLGALQWRADDVRGAVAGVALALVLQAAGMMALAGHGYPILGALCAVQLLVLLGVGFRRERRLRNGSVGKVYLPD